jgi:hypothetical protein
MNWDRRQLALKRWVQTVDLPTWPQPPQLAPRLPDGIINQAWPVFDRSFPRTIRWTMNTNRAICWATWHLIQPVAWVPVLGVVVRLSWTVGAAVQALAGAVTAVVLWAVITIPLTVIGAVTRAVTWVVLVRRGWQPPISDAFDQYLATLDHELDTLTGEDRP